MQRVALWVASTWNLIRELATDDAYERYLAHHAHAHAGARPMSRRAFYIQQQQKKWTGVKRCC